jgi:hypothetical protein
MVGPLVIIIITSFLTVNLNKKNISYKFKHIIVSSIDAPSTSYLWWIVWWIVTSPEVASPEVASPEMTSPEVVNRK